MKFGLAVIVALLALAISGCCVSNQSDGSDAAVSDDSGSCGENVTYAFDSKTGTLTIDGTGYMENWLLGTIWMPSGAPWLDYCTSIKAIIIGNGVNNIGDYAFSGCTGLTSMTIPGSVESIGYEAFRGCTGLTSVTVGNGVTYIESGTFYGCSGLTSVTVPDSVIDIGDYAFSGCFRLTSITVPDSVTGIGSGAFSGCSGLTSVTVGNGVTDIGSGAFSVTFCSDDGKTIPIGAETLRGRTYVGSDGKLMRTDPVVSYDANKGTGSVESVSIKSGETLNLPECSFVAPPATIFLGWSLTKDGKELLSDSVVITQNTKIYAVWSKLYTIRFVTEDGTIVKNVGFGDAVEAPENPTKENSGIYRYEFVGWEGFEESMTVTGDATFTAVFDAIVDVSGIKDGNSFDVTETDGNGVVFDSDGIKEIVGSAKADSGVTLSVNTANVTVVFGNEAAKSLNVAGNAKVSVSRLTGADVGSDVWNIVGDKGILYDISFGSNRDFGNGTAAVTLPYALAEGGDAKYLKVKYIEDGSVKETLDCTYDNGKVTFRTGHFSAYAIVYDEPSGSSGGNTVTIVIGAVAAVLAAAVAAVVVKKRNSA